MRQFDDAYRQAQSVTAKYAEGTDHVADLEVLYRLNIGTLLAFDLTRQWMRNIANFHEGKPYTKHVPFERIFTLDVNAGRGVAVNTAAN